MTHILEPEQEHPGMSVVHIPVPEEDGNLADITLTSRYPSKGYARNTESIMTVEVLEGRVVLECGGKGESLAGGMTVTVPTDVNYCWQPQPYAKLRVAGTPPWTKEQQRIVS